MRRQRKMVHPLSVGGAVALTAAAGFGGATRRLCDDRRGAAAVIMAAATASTLGVAGLTLEVGQWYLLRRNMQAAADFAAIAGAANLDATGSASSARDAAKSVTGRSGFVDGSAGTTVTAEPDRDTGKVVVTLARPGASRLLQAVGLVNTTGRTVRAQGIAQVVEAGAKPCVLALTGSIYVNNNSDLVAPGCAVVSNSGATDALDLKHGNGKGNINVASVVTHGGCEGCVNAMNNGRLNLPQNVVPTTYAAVTTTPYDKSLNSWSPPASATSNCRDAPGASQKKMSLTPGCYTSIDIKPSETADMQPGVYYIYTGALSVKGDLICTKCTSSSGVSIVMVGQNGGAPGAVSFSSQANVRLNASRQTDSALDGLVLYSHYPRGQRTGGTGNPNTIELQAGANVRLDGAVISFTSRLSLGGGAGTDANSCTVFIADSVEMKGNSSVNLAAANCGLYSTKTSGSRIPRLVQG